MDLHKTPKALSFPFPQGDGVLLVGPKGTGKSLALLLKLVDDQRHK